MPIINTKSGVNLDVQVSLVKSFTARIVGLIGTEQLEKYKALYFVPCSGIHTFGMKYPIDALFLDKQGKVVHICDRLLPNRMTKVIPAATAVMECAAGFVQCHQIKVGDRLQVTTDQEYRPSLQRLSALFHWPINIFMALLWTRFLTNAIGQWVYTGGFLNLGLIFHNTILLALFIMRRRSKETSLRVLDWIVPILTVGCAMMLKPDPFYFSGLKQISIAIQAVGVGAMIFSVISLGKSFGIVPANREIKYSGAYRIIRHPLYASEIMFHIGFLMGNYSVRNLFLVVFMFSGQIWRALSEEKLLSHDPVYQNYQTMVRFRFMPGVF